MKLFILIPLLFAFLLIAFAVFGALASCRRSPRSGRSRCGNGADWLWWGNSGIVDSGQPHHHHHHDSSHHGHGDSGGSHHGGFDGGGFDGGAHH